MKDLKNLNEKEYYSKYNYFSYSSINKLMYSPVLYYKDYILNERELSTEKHLIEGKLVHCLLFEPDEVKNKFKIVPGKTPSDSVRKVLKDMSLHTGDVDLDNVEDFVILDSLKNMNLYQSLKTNEQRIAKIRTEDNKAYWEFINNPIVDVIDQNTLEICKAKVDIIKSNSKVMGLLYKNDSDFELDTTKTFSEAYLECKLNSYKFGLKGFVDHYIIDENKKTITICDLKTTSKTIADFAETLDYYNYWLQAVIYCKLVFENHKEDYEDFTILFKFIVIDKYNQVYVFDVTQASLDKWSNALVDILEQVNYHYTENNYTLPYDFLVNNITI